MPSHTLYAKESSAPLSMKLLAAALAFCVFFSGCATDTPSQEEGPSAGAPGPNATEARVEVTRIPIRHSYSVGNQKGVNETDGRSHVIVNDSGCCDGGPVEVEENATAILAEVRWTCDSPTCRFVFELEDPDDQDVLRIYGDGPVRAEVPAGIPLTAGKWDAVHLPDSANIEVEGEIVISVFYNGPVPEGYSAF